MAYSYDLSTNIGRVRLAIGDNTGSATAFFMDEELTSVLGTVNNDTNLASVQALRLWARRLASRPKLQIGDYTIDPATTARNLMAAADTLAEQLGEEEDDPIIGSAGGDVWLRY